MNKRQSNGHAHNWLMVATLAVSSWSITAEAQDEPPGEVEVPADESREDAAAPERPREESPVPPAGNSKFASYASPRS